MFICVDALCPSQQFFKKCLAQGHNTVTGESRNWQPFNPQLIPVCLYGLKALHGNVSKMDLKLLVINILCTTVLNGKSTYKTDISSKAILIIVFSV